MVPRSLSWMAPAKISAEEAEAFTQKARSYGLKTAGMMIEVPPAEAGPGAVVLFRMRAGAIVKHVGILTGEGTFIHSYERLGVIEEPLTTAWRRRIAFAFLFPRAAPAPRKKKF